MVPMYRSLAFALLITVALGSCATLPPGSHFSKRASTAWAHPEQTPLGRKFADAPNEHPGGSAFRIISVGVDGFAALPHVLSA